jgi:hypothetical protein
MIVHDTAKGIASIQKGCCQDLDPFRGKYIDGPTGH